MSEHWRCPPFQSPTASTLRQFVDIFREIGRISISPDGPIGVTGFELKASLLLNSNQLSMPNGDNAFWRAKCNALFVRPAIEPIACSFWQEIVHLHLDDAKACTIVSALTANEISIRDKEIMGLSSGTVIIFEDRHKAARWLDDLKIAHGIEELHFVLPVINFVRVILSHPFTDGNGRFARVMIHGALGKVLNVDRPILALTPSIYRFAERLRNNLSHLNKCGDWEPLYGTFIQLFDDALRITLSLVEFECQQMQTNLKSPCKDT